MRLPFVSRAIYEDAITRAEKAEERAERQTERYHSVCERLVSMKKEGFVVQREAKPLEPAHSALDPNVEMAIDERAGGDPSLRRYLYKYAQGQTSIGRDPAEIIKRIQNGDDEETE